MFILSREDLAQFRELDADELDCTQFHCAKGADGKPVVIMAFCRS